MIFRFEQFVRGALTSMGVDGGWLDVSYAAVATLSILSSVYLLNLFLRKIVIVLLKRRFDLTPTHFGAILLTSKFFHRTFNLLPLTILYLLWPQLFPKFPAFNAFAMQMLSLALVVLGIGAALSLVTALQGLYERLPATREHSIKGLVQVIKIILYIIGVLLFLSVLLRQSPLYLLGGMSALAAVLMLVFKDTLLGFVAGIQLAANSMVRIGDWIVAPSQGADGIVVDLTLNTVKVENWNKSVAQFPTYTLVSASFVNWRGMYESTGRQIQRSLLLDATSITPCSRALLTKLSKHRLPKPDAFLKAGAKRGQNQRKRSSAAALSPIEEISNLSLFRLFVLEYLKNHPKINAEMVITARLLQQTGKVLPLEILCFSNEKSFEAFEETQTEIMDYLYARLSEFELRL